MTRAGDFYQESIKDTFHMLEYYGDVIAMRHYQQGAPHEAAKWSSVPIINCGDGWGEHPTQVLTDLYTITKENGHRSTGSRRSSSSATCACARCTRSATRMSQFDAEMPSSRPRGDEPAPRVQGRARREGHLLPRGRHIATSSARPTSSTWSRSSRPTTPRPARTSRRSTHARRPTTRSPQEVMRGPRAARSSSTRCPAWTSSSRGR
jgi:hypothetical protein